MNTSYGKWVEIIMNKNLPQKEYPLISKDNQSQPRPSKTSANELLRQSDWK